MSFVSLGCWGEHGAGHRGWAHRGAPPAHPLHPRWGQAGQQGPPPSLTPGVPQRRVKVAQARGKHIYFGQGIGGHCPVRGNVRGGARSHRLGWHGDTHGRGAPPFWGEGAPRSHPLRGRGLCLQLRVAGGVRRCWGFPRGLTHPRCPHGGGTCSPGDSCLAMHMPRGAGGMGARAAGRGSARCCRSWGLTAATVTVPQSSSAWWGWCPAVGGHAVLTETCPVVLQGAWQGPAAMLTPEGNGGTPKNEGHGGGSLVIPPAQGRVTAGDCPLGVSPHTLGSLQSPGGRGRARDDAQSPGVMWDPQKLGTR